MTNHLQKAIQLTKKHSPNIALVFDLDSTLFCMKYRTQAIIKDYIQKDSFVTESNLVEQMQSIQVTERDWSIQEILKNYDLDQNQELLKRLESFWRQCFFTNDYLHYDQPYTNSIAFVQHLYQLGGMIFYLTARKAHKMKTGTVNTLKKYQFPLSNEQNLILKNQSQLSDAEYKTKELQKISKHFKTILFFENEPVILNQVKEQLAHIYLFWMNSTHSRKETAPKTALPITMEYNF